MTEAPDCAAVTWVALLRAVNVGRANRIGMADLRASLVALGYQDVRTYVQSGNAVFSAAAQRAGELQAAIHGRLLADAGVDVAVVVLSAHELAAIAQANPLVGRAEVDEGSLHVMVFHDAPDPGTFAALTLPARAGEEAVLVGRALYLALPHGMGTTKLTGAYFERALGAVGTARNRRTVSALLEMAGEPRP